MDLHVAIERWPLAHTFTISRGAKSEAIVVVAEISDGKHRGRGECVPYARYSETPESVVTSIEAMKEKFGHGLTRRELQTALPAGAARNALDCALWDLEAKQSGRPVYEIAGLPKPEALPTAFTISLDRPEIMAAAAARTADWPLLKVKLGAEGDPARLEAIRHAAPKATLIVDANEGWTAENLHENIAACARAGVALIEQPLPESGDTALASIPHTVPICADESAHDGASLARLKDKYDCINIKLDKAGGLTEALRMMEQAKTLGFSIMAGCMVATSLSLAPAILYAQKARFVDLDGPLWLAKDRKFGLRYEDHHIFPAVRELWG